MIIQLNPPLPLRHISKGNFLAHFFHDPGLENLIMFTGFLDNGEIWTCTNIELRAQENFTLLRDFREKEFPRGKPSPYPEAEEQI